jgi:hypothetical protein
MVLLLLAACSVNAVVVLPGSSTTQHTVLDEWMLTFARDLVSPTSHEHYSCPGKATIDMNKLNQLIANAGIETPSDEELSCGDRQKSSSGDGCVWSVADFLGMLYDEGVLLLRIGGSQKYSFGSFEHGLALAWNLCVCDPEHSTKDGNIEISFGWERLYGFVQGTKIAKIRNERGTMSMIDLSAKQRNAILILRDKAVHFDIETSFDYSLLPTSELINSA